MMIHPDLIALWALINFSPCMRIGTGCRCNGLLSPMPAAPSPLEDAGFIIVPAAQARKFDFGSAQFAA